MLRSTPESMEIVLSLGSVALLALPAPYGIVAHICGRLGAIGRRGVTQDHTYSSAWLVGTLVSTPNLRWRLGFVVMVCAGSVVLEAAVLVVLLLVREGV